jgi:DNA-binding response OmpR family regulator
VTEDDEVLATAVAAGLRREGMAVDVAQDGAAALEHLAVNRYDVVVQDWDLPGVHGDDVCRTLAADRSETRVLMLTAARSVRERVEVLELGADGYLPKPFDFAELVARIRALGRRAAAPLSATLEHSDLSLDPAKLRVAIPAPRLPRRGGYEQDVTTGRAGDDAGPQIFRVSARSGNGRLLCGSRLR